MMVIRPSNSNISNHVLLSIFKKCKSIVEFKQAHAHLIVTGLSHPPWSLRTAITFSSLDPYGDIDYAFLLLLKSATRQTLFLFNTVIRGLAHHCRLYDSVFVFNQIPKFDLSPNNFTFTFLFHSCARSFEFRVGQQFHSMVIKNSINLDTFVCNSLIRLYSVCSKLNDAERVFDESENLDIVSWNTLMNCYILIGDFTNAFSLFDQMPKKNIVSWNNIITGLVREGCLDHAHYLFNEMPQRNLVSWLVMISGYNQNGKPNEALKLYQDMQKTGQISNPAVLVNVLSSCSQLGALSLGKWVHAYIQRNRVKVDSILLSALIDMYAKCGNIDFAMHCFHSSEAKDVFSYTAAISALSMNGQGRESLQLFEKMITKGIKPDRVCYLAVLNACSHMGLVERGFHHFDSMTNVHGINKELDHYACMVDLLARSGRLEEAERFIHSMPIEPDNAIWGALLGACRIHGNVEIGQRVGKILIESDRFHDGRYVILSNIYTESNKENNAEEIRSIMRKRNVKRVPGCSSIEVDGFIHEFVAGDTSHENTYDIYKMWNDVVREIQKIGYVADTKGLVYHVEEEEKDGIIGYHSEKLAIVV